MIIRQSKNGKFPLVLLHGWGLNSGVWDFVVETLEHRFDVFCIDLPGFGVNNKQKLDNYTLDALVEKIAPLCPQGAIVAGWSLGGLVATKLALQYPQKVVSLCLIASSPCFVAQKDWQGIETAVLRQFSTALAENTKKTIERFLAIQAMGSESARKDAKALKNTVFDHPPADIEALKGGLDILENSDLRDSICTLKMPVKAIYGQRDTLVALSCVEALDALIADFDYRVIAKASHAPFISHRENFMDNFNQLYLSLAF